MRIRIIVILMLVPLFNATAFSQSKKENVLYDNLLRSINEYYDNYIIENHDRIDSTYIDLFKYDPNQKKWHLSDYHAYYDLFH